MNIQGISRIINFLKRRYAPRGAYNSFLNTGEDLLVQQALLSHGIEQPSYVDIGCHHPVFGNLTYGLYRKGSRGVVVEPNKSLINVINKKRSGDVCVCGGVGKSTGASTFYSFTRDTRSTFSKKQADEWKQRSGQEYSTETISIFSLDSIIENYCHGKTPDLISIDTEGYEEEILSGFSWKYRPKVFCIESVGRKESIVSLLKSKGYDIYAETPANTIFTDILKE